jgi:diguanylate cyclase (GGDEF)-like protein/PAS domain S-box-containing protein
VNASGVYLDPDTLDGAADALLSRRGTVAWALTREAARAPLPDDERFAHVAMLPGQQETVVDFVVPADRMVVVGIWERAQAVGLAQGPTRLSSDPNRAATLTIVDATHRFGVWLGFLTPDDHSSATENPPVLDASLFVPARPRTVTLRKNLCGVITQVGDRVERMLGWTCADMLGRRSLDFIHPDDHERAIAQWLEMRARRHPTRVRVRHRHRDGRWLWVELENRFVGLDDPGRLAVVSELSDISDEMAAHEAVRQRETLFRRLAESLPQGLFLVGVDETIIYANARLSSILGVGRATTLQAQLATLVADDRAQLMTALAAAAVERTDRELEVEVVAPGTTVKRRCLATVTALSDEEGLPGAMVTLSDVTESALLHEELRRQATVDSLTGCLNRASTFAALRQVLDPSRDRPAVVLFIDLDHFKSVNDTFGHSVGDDLLADTVGRIASQVTADDVVGRIGGDEFLVIRHGLADPAEAIADANRLRQALAQTISVAGRSIRVSASIGITIATPGTSVQSVVSRADEAMYRSKRQINRTPVFITAPTDTGRETA